MRIRSETNRSDAWKASKFMFATTKTTENHEKQPKPFCKNQEQHKKTSFQTISQNQEFMVFLGFDRGFGGQELETTFKKPRKTTRDHEKAQNALQKPRKTQKHTIFKLSFKIKNSRSFLSITVVLVFLWFLVVFLVFTMVLVVKSSKPR